MSVNEWLAANSISAEPFEVTVAGHVFRFRRVRSLSERNLIAKRGVDLTEIVNGGTLEAWAGFGPIDAQVGYTVALIGATNIDTGDDKLSDGVLLQMQAEAGPMFNRLSEAYVAASGFAEDWVTRQVEDAKNA